MFYAKKARARAPRNPDVLMESLLAAPVKRGLMGVVALGMGEADDPENPELAEAPEPEPDPDPDPDPAPGDPPDAVSSSPAGESPVGGAEVGAGARAGTKPDDETVILCGGDGGLLGWDPPTGLTSVGLDGWAPEAVGIEGTLSWD